MSTQIKEDPPKNLAEQVRLEVIAGLQGSPTFGDSLPRRASFLIQKMQECPGQANIKNAGEFLSEAFRLKKTNRGQKGVSQAGVAWESLIVWYINLCLIDTHAVCLKGSRFCPKPIKESLELYIDNDPVGGEMDVLIFSTKHLLEPPVRGRAGLIRRLNEIAANHFSQIGVINLQCKTSWADNAQAVMLYNMLYKQASAGKAIQNGFRIGKTPFTLDSMGHFGYAFITVPTQKDLETMFKRDSTPVLRVKYCTAGNYWGHQTKNGIARNISEIFEEFRKSPDIYPKSNEAGAYSVKYFSGKTVDKIDGSKYFEV